MSWPRGGRNALEEFQVVAEVELARPGPEERNAPGARLCGGFTARDKAQPNPVR